MKIDALTRNASEFETPIGAAIGCKFGSGGRTPQKGSAVRRRAFFTAMLPRVRCCQAINAAAERRRKENPGV